MVSHFSDSLLIITAYCVLADERCARLLAVDPEMEVQRLQLKKEKETIMKAQEQLQGLSADDLYD